MAYGERITDISGEVCPLNLTPHLSPRSLYQDIVIWTASSQELLGGKITNKSGQQLATVPAAQAHTYKYTVMEDISHPIAFSKCISSGTIMLETKK